MKKLFSTSIWFLFIVPAIYLAIIWDRLPLKIPMHYNLAGEVDRYGNKTELLTMVMVLTAVNVGVYLLLLNVHRIDPKRHAPENRDRMVRMGQGIAIFITAIQCFFIYTSMNEAVRPAPKLIFSAVGLLFCFLGNYMFNIRPNYFAGIRLPWTLENEENWRRTHKLAGKLWFAGGLVIAIVSLMVPANIAFIILLVMVGIMVLAPAIYSYRYFRSTR